MKRLIIVATVVSLTLIIGACSELKNDNTPTQGNSTIHGVGFAKVNTENSHTKFLQKNGWNTQTCRSCHGFLYDGGTTKQSCTTSACHSKQNGPENCATCHGYGTDSLWKDLYGNNSDRSIRGVGAHQAHVGNKISCNACHLEPKNVLDKGHLDNTTGAEVRFDSVTFSASNPQYSKSTLTCTNTYCHGNFKYGNGNSTVTWTDVSGDPAKCGTCHGDATKLTLKEKAFPTTGHNIYAPITSDCSTCHGSVVNSSMTIIDPSRHANGRLN